MLWKKNSTRTQYYELSGIKPPHLAGGCTSMDVRVWVCLCVCLSALYHVVLRSRTKGNRNNPSKGNSIVILKYNMMYMNRTQLHGILFLLLFIVLCIIFIVIIFENSRAPRTSTFHDTEPCVCVCLHANH